MTADPYVQPIPQWVYDQSDDELRAWYEYDNRWKHDIWRQLGGGTDDIEDSTELSIDNANNISMLRGEVNNLKTKPYFSSQSSAYTTFTNEFIRVTAAATITLNATPKDGETVVIQPTGNFTVTIVGTINGSTPSYMNHAYDLLEVRYVDELGEWVA